MSEATFPLLNGYHLNELLYEGTKSLVYRGIRDSDSQPVVIKLLKRALPSHNELLNFRHQYNLLKPLEIEGVPKITLETWQEKLALIMSDTLSVDLKLFTQGQPIKINDFLSIAIQLARILSALYKYDIIHKDIKPGNIINQPQTGKVEIIDFSIATQLKTESQSFKHIDDLTGTISYISPEQTGRMNREIDYRTDFYSLGVTFYELLSGHLPFESDDSMELVHCHIARQAIPLTESRSDVPPVLDLIVQKLMAKNAEDRYQSAEGLLADLQNCNQQWQKSGQIEAFTLGQTDVSRRFNLPEKLYGRQKEVSVLLSSFDLMIEGQLQAVMIRGTSGIGKTALINEVHKPMTQSRGYFIKGKFEQLKQDKPFSALSQAFHDLIQQILTENEEQINSIKNQLIQALGQYAQLLIELVPELEQLIGPQPPVEELQGTAATHRFNHLIQQFLQVFTTREQPLVLFFDDLQWVDSATLQLMNIILNCNPDPQFDRLHQSLLFIGAYRDNETPPEHPLHHTLSQLKQTGLPVNDIKLSSLNDKNICDLITDAFLCDTKYAKPLTDVIVQKTQGNPFFIHQFLQQVSDQKFIEYDFKREHWCYQLDNIKQLAESNDVIDFLATRMSRLSDELKKTLTTAACIGNKFNLTCLCRIIEQSPVVTANLCWQAIQEKFLAPVGDDYKLIFDMENVDKTEQLDALSIQYRFVHDRIQQAAYSLINPEQQAQIHFRVGTLLKQQYKPDDSVDMFFNVVNHLNAGSQYITNDKEKEQLAEMNYQAASQARRATAYETAKLYCNNGLNQLNKKDCWQTNYNLTINLYNELIESEYLLGKYQSQEEHAQQLLGHITDPLDGIRTHQLHCFSLLAQDKPLETVKYALPLLKQLGVHFPENPDQTDFQNELEKTQRLFTDCACCRSFIGKSGCCIISDSPRALSFSRFQAYSISFTIWQCS